MDMVTASEGNQNDSTEAGELKPEGPQVTPPGIKAFRKQYSEISMGIKLPGFER